MHLQCRAGDQTRADLGQLTLAEVGELLKEFLGDDELQDRIAQKLEPLVVERVVLPLQ